MAIIYVNSAATGSNNGTSWVNAFASLASAAGAGSAAGDTVLVAYNHLETITSATTLNFSGGTEAAPIKVVSSDPVDSSYRTGGEISNAGASAAISTLQGHVVFFGLNVASTSASAHLVVSGTNVRSRFVDCTISLGGHISNGSTNTYVHFQDCTLTIDHFYLGAFESVFLCDDCVITASNATQTLRSFRTEQQNTFRNCDLSASNASAKLVDLHEGQQRNTYRLIDCTLPSTPTIDAFTVSTSVIEILGCVVGTLSAPKNGLTLVKEFEGDISSESAVYRSSGASDGTTDYSWKLATNGNAVEIFQPLKTPPITRWVGTGSQTLTVYVASGVTLNNDDVWIEVSSPGEGATPKAHGIVRNTKAVPQATPAALTTDAVSTWNGTGVGTKQKVAVTFNPAIAGPITIRCFLAKPSTTIYVDPKLEIA